MYIPKNFLMTDREEIIAFMQRFSFATLITAKGNFPVATPLPFLVSVREDKVILTAHFARANEQWKDITDSTVLVIFSEPHSYISPKNYEKELNVPTWNYIAVHAYGRGRLLTGTEETFEVLEATIQNYEMEYSQQWSRLPADYKLKMIKGIVTFEMEVTDLQGKKKLSQNRTDDEKQNIINSLSQSEDSNERHIAEWMRKEAE